jgi:hypothetical protein
MGDANQWYTNQLNDYYARQQAAADQTQAQYRDIGNRSMSNLGAGLQDYMATPYGRTAADTATSQAALQQVGAGGNPGQAAGLGGAASTWGAGIAARNQGFADRQQLIAGNANAQQRQSLGQNRALSDYEAGQTRLRGEAQDIAMMDAIRQAEYERQLQRLNMEAQGKFDHAQGVGEDLQMIGGLMGASGGLADYWGPTGTDQAKTAKKTDVDGGGGGRGGRKVANKNWSPTGRQTGGGYTAYPVVPQSGGYYSGLRDYGGY